MEACDDECADWAWPAQEARAELDTAVQRLKAARFETPDWAAAQHQWRLGQVSWGLGDAHHDVAKAAWMQAITIEGPCQVMPAQADCISATEGRACAGIRCHAADAAVTALLKASVLAVVRYVITVFACPMSPCDWLLDRPQDSWLAAGLSLIRTSRFVPFSCRHWLM